MLDVSQVIAQSPPDAVCPGKPAGVKHQSGENVEEFKEVLRKKKTEINKEVEGNLAAEAALAESLQMVCALPVLQDVSNESVADADFADTVVTDNIANPEEPKSQLKTTGKVHRYEDGLVMGMSAGSDGTRTVDAEISSLDESKAAGRAESIQTTPVSIGSAQPQVAVKWETSVQAPQGRSKSVDIDKVSGESSRFSSADLIKPADASVIFGKDSQGKPEKAEVAGSAGMAKDFVKSSQPDGQNTPSGTPVAEMRPRNPLPAAAVENADLFSKADVRIAKPLTPEIANVPAGNAGLPSKAEVRTAKPLMPEVAEVPVGNADPLSKAEVRTAKSLMSEVAGVPVDFAGDVPSAKKPQLASVEVRKNTDAQAVKTTAASTQSPLAEKTSTPWMVVPEKDVVQTEVNLTGSDADFKSGMEKVFPKPLVPEINIAYEDSAKFAEALGIKENDTEMSVKSSPKSMPEPRLARVASASGENETAISGSQLPGLNDSAVEFVEQVQSNPDANVKFSGQKSTGKTLAQEDEGPQSVQYAGIKAGEYVAAASVEVKTPVRRASGLQGQAETAGELHLVEACAVKPEDLRGADAQSKAGASSTEVWAQPAEKTSRVQDQNPRMPLQAPQSEGNNESAKRPVEAAADLNPRQVKAPASESSAQPVPAENDFQVEYVAQKQPKAGMDVSVQGSESKVESKNDPAVKFASAPVQEFAESGLDANSQAETPAHGFTASSAVTNAGIDSHTDGMARFTASPVQQIVQEMDQGLKNGKTTFRIQLHPQDLGTIDIRITGDAKGLGITILTDNAATRRMLESQMDTLRQSLDDAGLHLTHMKFDMGGQSGQSERPFYQNSQSQSNRGWYQRPWQNDEGRKFVEIPQKLSLTSSSVDYRV